MQRISLNLSSNLRLLFLAAVLAGISGLFAGCKGGGFLGCNNILAFSDGTNTYNATLFNNNLFPAVDFASGADFVILVMETENQQGGYFRLEIEDYRVGQFAQCITPEPYWGDIGLNYCAPIGAGFFCNNFRAFYSPSAGAAEYSTSGTIGQVVVATCDNDGQVTGTFNFMMEDPFTGDQIEITNGSFNVCYFIFQ